MSRVLVPFVESTSTAFRRIAWGLPVGLILGLQLLACCVPTSAPAPASANWSEFTHDEGRFSILFPDTPLHSTSADGLEHRYTAELDRGERVFRVSYEHDADASIPTLDRMHYVFDDLQADDTRVRVLQIADGEAVDGEYDLVDEGDVIHMRHRIYYVGNTMYQLIVAAPPDSYDENDVNRFLNSFEAFGE